MSDNQIQLVDNITNFLINSGFSIDEISKLKRLNNICFCNQQKEFLDKIYNFIKQNDLERHLLTNVLDRLLYWLEFILEIVYIKIKNLDISIKEWYSYWITWKIQVTDKNLLK